jgi:hypothetical protein
MHTYEYFKLIKSFIPHTNNCTFDIHKYSHVDRNSSVDIAIRYGLDGPGIESR